MSAPTLSAALMPVPLPAALPQGASQAPAPSSGPGAFAQELRQAQAGPAADARPAAASPAGDKARDAQAQPPSGDASDAPAAEGADKAAHRPASRGLRDGWNGLPRGARGATDDGATDATTATEPGAASARSATVADDQDAPPADPAAAFIATLLPRSQPVAPAAAPATAAAAATDAAATAIQGSVSHDAANPGLPDTDPADSRQATALPAAGTDRQAQATHRLHAQAEARQPETQRLATGGELQTQQAAAREPTAPLPAATPALPSFAAELARASQPTSAPTTTAGAAPATPTEVRLATPVPAPDFVPRFSAEVAILARDGVQEARVQVNPAELGPISVQITLDGQAAQVHLAVASDQTRQVLEQAMPSLAAALRESGLTLTGGGVFQQARQNGRDAAADGGRGGTDRSRGGRTDDGAAPVAAATPRRVRLPGAVDLYA